jgi:hypothetical protein
MRIQSRKISLQTARRGGFVTSACLSLAFVAACGGAALPPPSLSAPPAPSAAGRAVPAASPAAGPSDPFAVPAAPRDDAAADGAPAASAAPVSLEAWQKYARIAKGVGASPASCAAYVGRAPGKEPTDLAKAFAEKDPAKRDALLVAVRKQPGVDAAAVTAMRADIAPIECADAIVDPLLVAFLAKPAAVPSPRPDFMRVAVGLSLAGKLARTATAPPPMGALREKEKVKAFINGPLKAWLVEQSTAIELLSSGAAGLSGYARGVAAIEAGIAELRLVDTMRSAPVPATWDPELKAVYEAALDEALEPRKKRGRDAALVGMSDFARVGIVRDTRLDRARALLSKLYGGRRIDALDGLMMPAASAPASATTSDVAAQTLPTFWLDELDLVRADDPSSLARGVTRKQREHLRKLPESDAGALRSAYARARFDMGRMYWRRVDFVEAAHAAQSSKTPEDRLVLAVSLALAKGPNGAAEMMRAAAPAALGLSHTDALDALVAEGGPLAGLAAYDAAHLRALAPPDGPEVTAYLRDVAARFRKAEALLTDPAQKRAAAQRAAEIDAIVVASANKAQ